MKKIALFASGTGTNAKALLEMERTLKDIEISVVVTDNRKAGVRAIAREFGKDILVIPPNRFSREEHEKLIIESLRPFQVDWIFLAGYMRIFSHIMINAFYDKTLKQSRIINIHPSLLPQYKGLHAYEKAYADKAHPVGISIHFVDQGVDSGRIIVQKSFDYAEKDSFDDFRSKGLKLEHELYPQILKNLNTIEKEGHYEI